MAFGFTVEIRGDYACFSRPELKVERVSYEVMTPSAARGILEAVFWKPEIRYIIDEIAVCADIKFENIRRNEVNSIVPGRMTDRLFSYAASDDRAQRAAMVLKDVCYVVTAHFELTKKAQAGDTPGKYAEIIRRRLRKGQCFHMPYLGTREFPARLRLLEDGESFSPISETRSLGLMFHDFDYKKEAVFTSKYFMAEMKNGVIDLRNVEVMR